MLTLTLTPHLPNPPFQSCQLTLPSTVTFHQLHAVLEIILQPNYGFYYSFMLMSSRHAIEANTAGDYKAAPAFKQNPRIRYLNPYPETFVCLLELEDMDDAEASLYPQVKETGDDEKLNAWLKEYCCFTEDWQYKNEEFFRNLYQIRQQEIKKQRKKEQKQPKQYLRETPTDFVYHFKTMGDKRDVWNSFCMMYDVDESVRVTVGISEHSQAKLLEASRKEDLLNYCRYSGLSVGANWRKRQLAEAFCNNLQENTWLTMLYLSRTGLELYFRLCRLKENQKLSLSIGEESEALKVLMYLGMADLSFGNDETKICLELSGVL